MIGSASGVTPFGGPGARLALVPDRDTRVTLYGGSASPLQGATGRIGPDGTAAAAFHLTTSVPASVVGTVLHHAYLLAVPGTGLVLVSDPAPLTIDP